MRQKRSHLLIGEEQHYSDSKNPNFKVKIPPDHNEQDEQSLTRSSFSAESVLPTKSVALKLLKLLCLPTIYLFSFNHHISMYLFYMLFLIGFGVVVVCLVNLESIQLFVVRNLLPILKLLSGSKSCTPVVWSIGSVNKESTVCGLLVKVYNNGDVYEGEFYKGKCSGSGVYCYCNMNGRYEGDWIDHKYDGYGVETWAKGSRYRGQYREGLRHGFGVYRFYIGDMYAGEWVKGQCHGNGVHICADGSKYFGEFKGGVKHGIGHYHFINGDMYAGEYFADKMHGFGVYNFVNGDRYEGGWHEGKRQGFGLYTFRNGDTRSGHWDDGVLSINPLYPTSVSHAKVLKAVEEARRIAEKPLAVKNVDERVNRAMAAVSRAANAARVAAVKAVQSRVRHHGDP